MEKCKGELVDFDVSVTVNKAKTGIFELKRSMISCLCECICALSINNQRSFEVRKYHLLFTESPMDDTSYESSTFLKSNKAPHPPTRFTFNFILASPLNEIRPFFVTVIKKKFPNVFYAYDSSSFCLLRSPRDLNKNKRYVVYGKLSKNKFYFLESLREEEIDYKELCYMLI